MGLCATLIGRVPVGVSVRNIGDSRSARRINWIGCSGDPGDELLIDFGLAPVGVDNANEGMWDPCGSGVLGCNGGLSTSWIEDCCRVAELIHFSSRAPMRGGDSGRTRKASAKCSLMNLPSI